MASFLKLNLLTLLDVLTESGLYFMVIFGPWAFGTTQPWSIQVMNIAGYSLGVILFFKWLLRRATGYHEEISSQRRAGGEVFIWSLALLTVLLLGFILISAWNARASYQPGGWRFTYYEIIPWLPHSFDQDTTWRAFWMYLGLACSFWAIRDWLLYPSKFSESYHAGQVSLLTPRLRRLLWVLSINGAILALVSIIQRLDGTGKLLWLVEPRVNKAPVDFFGPYAYRANAAQYFNLLWPATLGFWWTFERARKRISDAGNGRLSRYHHLLLACVVLMAVCPIITTSRGGAIIMVGLSTLAVVVLGMAHWRQSWLSKICVFGFMAIIIWLALLIGWHELGPRMEMFSQGLQDRNSLSYVGKCMADDNPVFGTGAGTFQTMFQLYQSSNTEFLLAQMHNDWMETRITFGWVGFAMIVSALAACLVRWFFSGGNHGNKYFVMLMWCALAGSLLHAWYDFPFQIHSILFLFLLHCSILSTLSRK